MNLPWSVCVSGGAVANHLWQSTAFALTIWLLTLVLRRNAARIRYGLWFAASLKFLVPFSLLVALGSLLPHPQPTVRAAPETIYFAVDLATQPFTAWNPTLAPHPSPTLAQLATAYLPEFVLALWIGGTMTVLLTWFVRWRRLQATGREAVPAYGGRELDLLRKVELALPARSPLPLRFSSELIEPGIFGILRPVLVWPAQLTGQLEDEHMESILTHELIHAHRRDNLTAALHMLVEAAFWFHPLVWWIGRRLINERERACDEAVVQLGGCPEAYAESLLKACRFCIGSPLPCVSGITGADLRQRIVGIVNSRTLPTSWWKKLFLATVLLCVTTAPIVLGKARAQVAAARMLQAQQTASSGNSVDAAPGQMNSPADPGGSVRLPAWDVISVRQSDGQKCQGMGMGKTADAVDISCVPLEYLIQQAYGIPEANRIVGAPDWMRSSARYDIHAKVAGEDVAAFSKLGPQEMTRMLQLLLADRFQMNAHLEKREMPVYDLVVAKGGPKLKQATPEESAKEASLTGRPGEIGAVGAKLSSLPSLLSNEVGRPVVNKTGLSGKYDFTLEYVPASRTGADETGGASVFTALEEQLGLKLEKSKEPMDVLVIDHIEKPSVDGAESQLSRSIRSAAPIQEQSKQATTVASASSQFPLAFEVISIRENKSGDRQGRMVSTDDGWHTSNLPFQALVQVAFLPKPGGPAIFPNGSLIGVPDWARNRYDVQAKVPQSLLADWQNPAEQPSMVRAMLQTMLAERCGLKLHRDSRTVDILALEVNKGGPKLKPADPNVPPHPEAIRLPGMGIAVPEDSGRTLHFYGANMAMLLNVLDKSGTLNIEDKTGLAGRYDFVVHMPQPPDAASADGSPRPDPKDFAEAIADQVGLKLVPTKGQVEILVIDHIGRPTEN